MVPGETAHMCKCIAKYIKNNPGSLRAEEIYEAVAEGRGYRAHDVCALLTSAWKDMLLPAHMLPPSVTYIRVRVNKSGQLSMLRIIQSYNMWLMARRRLQKLQLTLRSGEDPVPEIIRVVSAYMHTAAYYRRFYSKIDGPIKAANWYARIEHHMHKFVFARSVENYNRHMRLKTSD